MYDCCIFPQLLTRRMSTKTLKIHQMQRSPALLMKVFNPNVMVIQSFNNLFFKARQMYMVNFINLSDAEIGELVDMSLDQKDQNEAILYQNQLDDPAIYAAYLNMLEGWRYCHINTFNASVLCLLYTLVCILCKLVIAETD